MSVLYPPRTGGQFTSDSGFDQRGPPPEASGWYLGGQNSFPCKAILWVGHCA
jgi:hypothetical protein